jgi:ankyrin repeat protein
VATASEAAQVDAPDNSAATSKLLTLDDLFPTDRVLDVQISLAEADWDKIRQQSRNLFDALQEERKYAPIKGPYTYVDASVTIDGVEFPQVGIRKKGFIGSQSSSRPSLKIKINHVDKQGGIEGLTNLTLNNNKQDPTLVSQFMGYALFNAAGSPAPRCAFASVTVNGKHLGVYTHVESMRKPLIQRAFGNVNGTLYEGTVVDFVDGWEGSFERKFGNDATGRKKIAKLIDFMLQHDQLKDDQQGIGELVDLDSFYTFWAVEGLLGAWDGYSGNGNNYFVYVSPKTAKFHFLPWGADALFEKHSKIAYDPQAPISVKTKGLIAHKLYQLPSGRERYAKTLIALLDKLWVEESLLAEITRIEAMLNPHLGDSQQEHGRSLDRVRKFIRSRREEIVAEIKAGMPVWTKAPEPPPIIPATFARNSDSIWNAANTGNIQAIEKHLSNGADVNAKHDSGTTPLSMAALAGEFEAVKFLISREADINAKNNDGHSALHGAAFLGRMEVVQLLIANKADVNIRNKEGETPLDSAAAEWSDEIRDFVQFISSVLQVEVDLEEVQTNRPQVAALLREHGAISGADLAKPTGDDIWQSAKLGNVEALRRHLAKSDVGVNALDTNGVTALSWASLAGEVETAEFLLLAGASINTKNRDGNTSLHGAAFLGRTEVVELLIQNNPEINLKNSMGQTPLDGVAAEWNQGIQDITKFIGRFLKVEVDIEQIKAARPKIAKLLRQHGGKTSAELQ